MFVSCDFSSVALSLPYDSLERFLGFHLDLFIMFKSVSPFIGFIVVTLGITIDIYVLSKSTNINILPLSVTY